MCALHITFRGYSSRVLSHQRIGVDFTLRNDILPVVGAGGQCHHDGKRLIVVTTNPIERKVQSLEVEEAKALTPELYAATVHDQINQYIPTGSGPDEAWHATGHKGSIDRLSFGGAAGTGQCLSLDEEHLGRTHVRYIPNGIGKVFGAELLIHEGYSVATGGDDGVGRRGYRHPKGAAHVIGRHCVVQRLADAFGVGADVGRIVVEADVGEVGSKELRLVINLLAAPHPLGVTPAAEALSLLGTRHEGEACPSLGRLGGGGGPFLLRQGNPCLQAPDYVDIEI